MRKNLTMVLVCSLFFCVGCGTRIIVPSKYSAGDNGGIQVNADVVISEVVDKRETINERKYYSYYIDNHGYDGDFLDGFYDQPVRDVVKDVLIAEFRQAGVNIVEKSAAIPDGALALKCEIVKYNMSHIGKLTGKNEAEEVLALQFKWTDRTTGMLIEANKRTSRMTFKKKVPGWVNKKSYNSDPRNDFNLFMSEDKQSIRDSGIRLLNVHLPKVIRAELRMSKVLNKK
ncbi:MAG: hypothetical protein KAJ46_05160 [Sedimentisphaerales bacterium]|nr:hypothetical protein [Sedimentisphaerales bacterium]